MSSTGCAGSCRAAPRWTAGLRSGVVAVRIVPESVDAIGNHEVGLFGAGPDERIHSGLSRVQSMLGHEGVLTAVVSGGRTLADRTTAVPWGDRPLVPRSAVPPWPGQLPLPLPATVFSVPLPVFVYDADGADVAVDERGTFSAAPGPVLARATGQRTCARSPPGRDHGPSRSAGGTRRPHASHPASRSSTTGASPGCWC